MSKVNNPDDASQIEAYLDGALQGDELASFESRLRGEAALREQVELQRKIDQTLLTAYPAATIDDQQARDLANQVAGGGKPTLALLRQGWLWGAAAAALLLAVWLSGGARSLAPHFEPTPLAKVYETTLQQGFEPYYECEDEARFKQVFALRQGRPLRLLEMPPGSRMLGLSYPGGLSRDTTAMLCEIDGSAVMVFVDRQQADAPQPERKGLYVHREVHDGLVFYEVSPFEQPRALRFLIVD